MPAQYPRLSGQHADYTISQLTSFRDGIRKNSIQMTQVAAKLNDREIKAVADYIAGLR
jgi:cytochrome c553